MVELLGRDSQLGNFQIQSCGGSSIPSESGSEFLNPGKCTISFCGYSVSASWSSSLYIEAVKYFIFDNSFWGHSFCCCFRVTFGSCPQVAVIKRKLFTKNVLSFYSTAFENFWNNLWYIYFVYRRILKRFIYLLTSCRRIKLFYSKNE